MKSVTITSMVFANMENVVGKNILMKFVKVKAVMEEMNVARDILENVNSSETTEGVSFDHSEPIDAAEEELKVLKQKLDDLEKTIEVKNAEIKAILVKLDGIETNMAVFNSEHSNLKIRLSSSCQTPRPSSVSVISTNNSLNTICEGSMNEENFIPQLDGCQSMQMHICKNCETTFETDEQLKKHMQEHEWGCDDCKLCCTSKYFVDLHELEHHGDTPDSMRYIRDDIPELTKKL